MRDGAEAEVARLVRAVYDPVLAVEERQASWSRVDALVRGWMASPEAPDDDLRRASVAAAEFFVACCKAGSWDRERTVEVAAFALARCRELEGEIEREASLALELAKLHVLRGDARAGAEELDATLARIGEPHPSVLPWCFLQRGTLARLESRPVEALSWFERARAALRPEEVSHHRLLLPVADSETASLFLDLGLPDAAAAAVARQRRAAREIANPVVRRGVDLQEVRVDVASGRASAAIAHVERVIAEEERAAAPFAGWAQIREQLELCRGIAQAELSREAGSGEHAARAREALERCSRSEALNRVERVEADLQLAELASRARDHAATRAAIARVDAALVALAGAGPRPESLQTARLEALRAGLALDAGATAEELAACCQALRASWRAFHASWARTPLEESGVGFLQYAHRRSVLGALIEIALAVEGPERGAESGFGALLEAQALGTLARRARLAPGSIGELRAELLVPGEVVFVWLPAPRCSHLFVLDAERLTHEELAPATELQAAQLACVRELVARPASGPGGRVADEAKRAFERAGSRLASLLWTPRALEALRSARCVTAVGAELLGWTPLEALPIEGLGTLGRERPIARLPSLPVGLWLARRARADPPPDEDRPGLVALVAPTPALPVSRAFALAPIPGAAEHARELRSQGARTVVLEGAAATRDALLAAVSRGPRVLYVLAHGVHEPDLPRPTGLALAAAGERDDGVLRCADVDPWSDALDGRPGALAADLVLLASCGASRAPLRRGEDGANHLGGAWLAAGASAVVLSPADLDAEATIAALRAFLASSSGSTPADSLRRARAALARDARFDHPYFDGTLQVVGRAHAPAR